ncbi:hypothetical protein BU25DRAFT_409872 [Macroventuria anomochaeta]|uniref:Uncharacterized protein n=1 Tax=Macroventuria anomochaeta TaxID=301207 RepID=A0ACB6S3L0_9PLEO|nr:uncharacterized protein BU25DRAFT_409872 [Macroventuria anomochaeta]KAF2628851.1 hypothetical protein BU25DRAFT_409872 [Macroventuria anomochaeta]
MRSAHGPRLHSRLTPYSKSFPITTSRHLYRTLSINATDNLLLSVSLCIALGHVFSARCLSTVSFIRCFEMRIEVRLVERMRWTIRLFKLFLMDLQKVISFVGRQRGPL